MNNNSVNLAVKLSAGGALQALDEVGNSLDNLMLGVKNFGKAVKESFNNSAIIGFAISMKELTNGMIKLATPQAEFIENLNLMEVAFDKDKDAAYGLLDSMSDVFGLDPSRMSKQLGTYRQMASAMDLSSDTATLLSNNLLKLQDDVSSLYNIDTQTAFTKLQSAMAGQSRAVRTLGVDITTTGLQNELYRRGIDMTVDELSSAGKEVLIYLTMEHQLQNAQGDLAKTTNSVANQTRIFREQCAMLTRQLGAFLIPVLQTVLPVLNGIIMALNTIIGIILSFFHIDAKGLASQFGIATSEIYDMADGFNNVGSNIDKANKSAKEAKKSLRGFDKLNAIYTPTTSNSRNSSSVGAISGGVPKALLEQLKEYDNKMGEVQSKAEAIRDAILKALGFSEDLNGQWKFSHMTLWGVLGILVGIGGIVWAVTRVYKVFKSISGIGKTVGKVISGKGLVGKKDIKDTADSISGAGDIGDTINNRADSFQLPKFTTVLKGIGEIATIIGAMVLIVAAIGALTRNEYFGPALRSGTEEVKQLAIMLAIAVVPFGAFSYEVVVLGKIPYLQTLKGIATFATILGALTAVVGAIGAITSVSGINKAIDSGIEQVEKLASLLVKVIVPIGLFSAGVVVLGTTALPAVAGIGVFTAIIFSLVGVVEAFGVLSETTGFDELIADGGNALIKIAEIIGSFAGTIVSSFVESSLDFLPAVGTQLSDFMQNLQPFVKGSKDIDPNMANAVKSLAEACMVMTGQQLVDNLINWRNKLPWSEKKNSIVEFGKQLSEFGPYFTKYAKSIKDVTPDTVTASANAAKSLAEMSKQIPNEGWSIARLFVGDNKLSVWSKELPIFGENFAKFNEKISGIDNSAVERSKTVVKATQKIIDMAKEIPNEGASLVSFIVGDNGLKAFGWSIYKFGDYFNRYNSVIGNINLDKVSSVTAEVKKIVDMAKTIQKNGLGLTLEQFGNSVNKALSKISSAFSAWNAANIGYNFGVSLANYMINGIKNTKFPTIRLTDIDGGMITKAKISVYANGGFPEDGLFFANHNEMVGKFSNGKTAVANNGQIVNGIAQGVRGAMLSVKQNNQNVNLKVTADDDSIARFFKFKQNQDDRQYGF